jgi:hypothetical protein
MKLTIELVPSTSWYSNVRSNVKTKEWDIIRKKVYLTAGNKCEICGGRGKTHPVECHEVWEYDDINHTQTLVKMIALCPGCHRVKHIGRAQITGEYLIALAHLAKVNKITRDDADLYIQAQFEKWAQRSAHKWYINIDIIKKYLEG